jgi:hypothetical protein
VVWTGSAFLAAGKGGALLHSADGMAWDTASRGPTHWGAYNDLYGLYASNNIVMAGGMWGAIWVSADTGRTWTERDSASTMGVFGFAYTGTQYIAISKWGRVLTSPDGRLWTNQATGSSEWLQDIVFHNGLLVVVGTQGAILTSTNGTSWTPRVSGTTDDLHGIAITDSGYAVVGDNGCVLLSRDGTTWQPCLGPTDLHLNGVLYADSRVFAVGQSGTIISAAYTATRALPHGRHGSLSPLWRPDRIAASGAWAPRYFYVNGRLGGIAGNAGGSRADVAAAGVCIALVHGTGALILENIR